MPRGAMKLSSLAVLLAAGALLAVGIGAGQHAVETTTRANARMASIYAEIPVAETLVRS